MTIRNRPSLSAPVDSAAFAPIGGRAAIDVATAAEGEGVWSYVATRRDPLATQLT